MSHAAFCTARALQADLRMLGYKHAHDVECVAPSGDERLATLRFLAEEIGGEAFVEPDSELAAFYERTGLPSAMLTCEGASNAQRRLAAAAFLRAAIDLAAACRARRAIAPELDFDPDVYGAFTPEDDAADREMAALVSRRHELFPRTAAAAAPAQTKRRRTPHPDARKPLASRDANAGAAAERKRQPRKPPLPAAAVKRQPPAATLPVTPTVAEILRDARKRADTAVKEAVRSGVPVSDIEVVDECDEVPAVIEAADFFTNDMSSSPVSGEDPASSEDAFDNDDTTTTSTETPCKDAKVNMLRAQKLRREIDALAAEAASALQAVRKFEAMAAPMLNNPSAATNDATQIIYDPELDAELTESVLVAHAAQKRMLAELRAHVDITRSYSALERWAQASPPEHQAAKYCRQRAESALAFTNAIEAD